MEKQSKSLHNILLAFILLGALLIRVIGIFPGHPADHPDEPMSTGSALEMLTNDDLNPRRFDYPAGVPLLHYGIYKSVIIPLLLLKNPTWIPSVAIDGGEFFKEHSVEIFGKNGIYALYWSRYITAFMGVLSVYFTYLLAKKMFHDQAGLFAAFFVAFNYRHVLSSHLALSDIPNNLFVLIALFSCWLLWEKPTKSRYMLAAIACAVSLSMKYQYFAILPFLFTHAAISVKKNSAIKLFHSPFIFSCILIPIVFLAINLYLVVHFKEAWPVIHYLSLRYGFMAQKFNLYPLLYLYYWGIGVMPFILISIGILVSFMVAPFRWIFLFTYLGPFLYTFLYYSGGGVYVRNFTTIIPVLFIFAGVVLWKLSQKISFVLIFIIIFAFNFPSIRDSILLATSYSKPWSKTQMTEWVIKNIPDNSIVINDNVSLPTSIERQITIQQWNTSNGGSITELMHEDVDFAVLNTSWNQIHFFWHGLPTKRLLRAKGIPFEELENSYHGLLLSEYLRYTVYEAYKPWQAPENAYLIMKIPPKPMHLGDAREKYQPGKISSLWTSPKVSIWDSTLFMGEASVKALMESQGVVKDGFLRLDFYDLHSKKLQTSVSGRVLVPGESTKLDVIAQVPQEASFVTVSFQSEKQDIVYEIESITLYGKKEKLGDKFSTLRYILPTISKNELFPRGVY